MQLNESQTYLNLAKSFAGESQAHVRYKFIEYGARKEGLNCLSEVIDKIVYNEFNHARMFYTFIQKSGKEAIANIDISAGYPFKQKWDLTENLRLAAEDEKNEFERIYPEFARIAEKEGFTEIAELYRYVLQVENCHFKLTSELYAQLSTGTMYKRAKKIKWKCSVCGHEETLEEAWTVCPLCKSKQGDVMLALE